jgi:hypothetical protein
MKDFQESKKEIVKKHGGKALGQMIIYKMWRDGLFRETYLRASCRD